MLNIKRNLIGSLFFFACFSASALDGWQTKTYTQVITLSGGIGWAQGGRSETVYLPNYTVTYAADKTTTTVGQGELFLGLQWPFNDCILNQLGFAFGGAGTAKMQGTVDINSVPTSRYQYKIGHGMITARGKMIASPKLYVVQPYITGSVGAGFNQSYAFGTSPGVDPGLSSQWFQNKTFYSLTYSLGLGAQKTINDNWNVGMGYEFTNWGQSALGTALTTPFTYEGPQLTTLYVHSLMFSLTYLC